MRRRDFIAGGSAAVVLSAPARAEQSTKRPTIGFLGAASPELAGPWVAAFVKRLGELGWTEGRNVAIEYHWAEARTERYSEIATELANRKVDVIVTWASAPVLAAKRATTTIPIVFGRANGPGWCRGRCEPRAAWRQRHRHVDPADRYGGQTYRVVARGATQACPARGHGEFQCPGRDDRNARGRNDGTHARS